MRILRARRTAAAVAAAFLMPTAITMAAQTVEFRALEWMFPSLTMSHLEGSVITADSTATTVNIDCRSQFTDQCTSSDYTLPQTFTSGPSIQGNQVSETTSLSGTITLTSVSMSCNVTSTSLGASCTQRTVLSTSTSFGGREHAGSGPTYLSPILKYKTLAVVSGLEKLQTTSTAASNASPSGMTITASAPTATTTSNTIAPDNSSSSSSNAWIAGMVIGTVAGVALAAALAFWLIRRRRKGNAGAEDVLPQELPASYQPQELPDQTAPAELPDKTASAELPGHKSDGKAQSPDRNVTHELA